MVVFKNCQGSCPDKLQSNIARYKRPQSIIDPFKSPERNRKNGLH